MRKNRRDTNQQEIVTGLREAGYVVVDLSRVGDGCPDILVSKDGYTHLIEIKSKNGKLRESQKYFMQQWRGSLLVVKTLQQALEELADYYE